VNVVFGWFYRHLARGILLNVSQDDIKIIVQGFLSDPEVQKGLMEFTDSFYERYKLKVLGTLGGLQKGINYAVNEQNPLANIVDSKGQISLKRLIPVFIENYIGKTNKPPESKLP